MHRIGYRGTTLLLLAAIDFAYGLTFIRTDPSQRLVNRYLEEAIPFATNQTSAGIWLVLWWTTGLFCLVNAFRRADRWGYAAAVMLKVAYVAAVVNAGVHGMPNATTRGVVWGFIAAWVMVEARRAEPHRDIGELAREMEETGDIPRLNERGEDA